MMESPNSLLYDDETGADARLGRERGRGPLGSPGTSSSPDNTRIPARTPGSIGSNPYKLSGRLELHVFRKADLHGKGDSQGYALFEYDGSGRYHEYGELSFPHGDSSRGYYQEGDVILIGKVQTRYAAAFYPKLVPVLGGELLTMLRSSMGDEITLGYVIRDLSSTRCFCQLVMFFGGQNELMFLVEDISIDPTLSRLEESFRSARIDHSGWQFIKAIAPIIANFATGLLGGTVRGAVRALGFKVVKSQLKERIGRVIIVRVVRDNIGEHTRSAIVEFAKASAKTAFDVGLRPDGLHRRDGTAVDKVQLRQSDVQRILVAGCVAFVSSLISASGSKVTEGLGKDANRGAGRWFAERLTAEIVKLVPNLTKTILGAYERAFDELMQKAPDRRDSQAFLEAMAKNLQSSIGRPLEAAATNLVTTTGGLTLD